MPYTKPKAPDAFSVQEAAAKLMFDTESRSNEPKPSAFAIKLGTIIRDMHMMGEALVAGDRTDEIHDVLNVYDSVYEKKLLPKIKELLAAAKLPEDSYSKILGFKELSLEDADIVSALYSIRRHNDRGYAIHAGELHLQFSEHENSDGFCRYAFEDIGNAVGKHKAALTIAEDLAKTTAQLQGMHVAGKRLLNTANRLEQWQKAIARLAASSPYGLTITEEQKQLLQDNGRTFREALKTLDEVAAHIPDEIDAALEERFHAMVSALGSTAQDSLPSQVRMSKLQGAVQSFTSRSGNRRF